MASASKRKRTFGKLQPKKRPRVVNDDNDGDGDGDEPHSKENRLAGRTGQVPGEESQVNASEHGQFVVLSDLAWKEVALPDRLEDAEGFFGLEEIDDVEVIRDGGGPVRFRTKSSTTAKSKRSKDSESRRDIRVRTPTMYDGDGEWDGFKDETVELQPEESTITAATSAPSKEEKRPEKSILKKKVKDKAGANLQPKGGAVNAFSLLPEDTGDSGIDISAWDELNLSTEVVAGVSNLAFAKPTAIQKACIPEILAGHDVIGKAATGSGKTLTYGIPILQACLSRKSALVALVLSPTRELAHQIAKHLLTLFEGSDEPPRIATVTGGLSIQKQERQLTNANVVIATPGRLWEVIENSSGLIERLRKIQMLVVDEADRLLSEGHFQEVGKILEYLDKEITREPEEAEEAEEADADVTSSCLQRRQVLVFSATFSKGLQQKLAGKARAGEILNNQQSMEYLIKKLPFHGRKPKFIDVNPINQMVSTLKEGVVECGAMEKDIYLYTLVLLNPSKRTLVFTNSISAVRRLTALLQNLGLPSVALHSTMPQKARLRSVERFSASNGSIMIATDVAARGLDIKGIELIIHFHVPRTADMYVHRSGRTARAEASGKSILLCSPDETAGVTRLIAKVHLDNGTVRVGKTAIIPIELDRQLVNRLTPRIKLSQRITDAAMAKEKSSSQGNWLHQAAEDLGVEYDSEEFAEQTAKNSRGRNKSKAAAGNKLLTKAELGSLKAQLKDLLSKRVNLGVSEKYLAGGTLDVNKLLREREMGMAGRAAFLGSLESLNF